MNMGLAIKKLRKDKGLTQEKLSELVGVSLQTIRRWEWGDTVPSSKLLSDLARILGTTPELLLDNNSDEDDVIEMTSFPSNNVNSKDALVYEWGGKNRIALPNTPETRDLFERLMKNVMNTAYAPTV